MCGDHGLVFEPLLERDGVTVSRSPWGPDDQIGRLNWITPEATAADPRQPRRPARLRPLRRLLQGHAVLGRGR